MVDENIIKLSDVGPAEPSDLSDDNHLSSGGRCRIYNSSFGQIGCKDVSSETACQQ